MESTTYIETGNTTIKIAHPTADGRWLIERVSGLRGTLNRLERRASRDPILLAPVAEQVGHDLAEMLDREGFAHRVIRRSDFTDFLDGSYDTPESLGLDRILNLRGLREDGVVISSGTCITVDLLYDGRPHFGGILPGYSTAATGMAEAVPALPKASLDGPFTLPSRTSQSSVNLGILVGTTEGALGVARHLLEGAGTTHFANLPLVLTGGGAGVMAATIRKLEKRNDWPEDVRIVPGLLFEGMGGSR